jgi:hypothetical protein
MAQNKYEKGKIYKIVDRGYNLCYYGSTCQELSNRMAGHRSDYAIHARTKAPMSTAMQIFEEYGVENCKIELVELYPCASKAELNAKEGEYIKNNPCVNKCVPGGRMSRHDYGKQYYQAHKEQAREYNAKYREEHLDELKEKQKEYRERNHERRRASQKEQFICEACGGRYQRNDRAKHFRSIKHQAAIHGTNPRNVADDAMPFLRAEARVA